MQVKRNDKHFRFNFTCNNKVTKRKREKFAWRKKDLKLQLECSEEWRVLAAQEALDLKQEEVKRKRKQRSFEFSFTFGNLQNYKTSNKRDQIQCDNINKMKRALVLPTTACYFLVLAN